MFSIININEVMNTAVLLTYLSIHQVTQKTYRRLRKRNIAVSYKNICRRDQHKC